MESTSRTSPPRAASRSRSGYKQLLDIPIFHDDQHGTAIVALAALENALALTGRDHGRPAGRDPGAGAAGIAVTRMLLDAGIGDIVVADRQGVVHSQHAAT